MEAILSNGHMRSGLRAKDNVEAFWALLLFVILLAPVGAWAQAADQPVWQGVLRNPAGAVSYTHLESAQPVAGTSTLHA